MAQNIMDADYDSGRKKRRFLPLIIAGIFVLLLGGLATVIFLNLFGWRDNYVVPFARNLPLVGNLFSGLESETEDGLENGETPAIPQRSVEELTVELERLSSLLAISNALNSQYEEQIAALEQYRDVIEEFLIIREEFDRMIAEEDPDAFTAFYASIEPETAERIFQEIISAQVLEDAMRTFARDYANMESENLSTLLEELVFYDLELALDIVRSLSSSQRTELYEAMSTETILLFTLFLAPGQRPGPLPGLPDVPVIEPGGQIPIITPETQTATEEAPIDDITDEVDDVEE